MMSGMKGFLHCCNYFSNALTNWGNVSYRTLTLVAFRISKAIDPNGHFIFMSLGQVTFLYLCIPLLKGHDFSGMVSTHIRYLYLWTPFTIKDKSVRSSMCASPCYRIPGCSIVVVFVPDRVIAIILGVRGLYYTTPQWAAKNFLSQYNQSSITLYVERSLFFLCLLYFI